MKKWLVLGLGQGKDKITLEHVVVPERKGSKNGEDKAQWGS